MELAHEKISYFQILLLNYCKFFKHPFHSFNSFDKHSFFKIGETFQQSIYFLNKFVTPQNFLFIFVNCISAENFGQIFIWKLFHLFDLVRVFFLIIAYRIFL